MIYITKIPRKTKNAFSKAKIIYIFENDQEFLEYMYINNLMIYDKENKLELEFIDKSSLTKRDKDCNEGDSQFYDTNLLFMTRDKCKDKPAFVTKLIRDYKLKKLLDDS